MLDALKFVQGAVAKKDLLPALTHFRIEGNTVRSYNGVLALSSPIPFNIECTPKAIPFVKAIQNCKDTVVLSITPTGRLSVKSGLFSAFIECVDVETPHVLPEGESFDIDGAVLLKAFSTLYPLIGEDASRPWSNGLLLRGQSAFATNNVILCEYWVGIEFPFTCNIPRECVNEMLRIKTPPIRAQATNNSITFHYEDGRWIRTGLFSTEWPAVEKLFNKTTNQTPINPLIFEAIKTIEPFSDKLGRVYIYKDTLSTCLEAGEGARYAIPDLGFEGVYAIDKLSLLQGLAITADFTLYPEACHFRGERLRGVIIGLRT